MRWDGVFFFFWGGKVRSGLVRYVVSCFCFFCGGACNQLLSDFQVFVVPCSCWSWMHWFGSVDGFSPRAASTRYCAFLYLVLLWDMTSRLNKRNINNHKYTYTSSLIGFPSLWFLQDRLPSSVRVDLLLPTQRTGSSGPTRNQW